MVLYQSQTAAVVSCMLRWLTEGEEIQYLMLMSTDVEEDM